MHHINMLFSVAYTNRGDFPTAVLQLSAHRPPRANYYGVPVPFLTGRAASGIHSPGVANEECVRINKVSLFYISCLGLWSWRCLIRVFYKWRLIFKRVDLPAQGYDRQTPQPGSRGRGGEMGIVAITFQLHHTALRIILSIVGVQDCMGRVSCAGLMLGRRRRRRPSIEPAQDEHPFSLAHVDPSCRVVCPHLQLSHAS